MRVKITSLLSLLQFDAVCIALTLSTLSVGARAQAPNTSFGGGWNAIMNSTGTQSSSLGFVDLVAYQTDGRCPSATCDICMAMALALSDYSANQPGIAIDARGMNTSASLTCHAATLNGNAFNGNPWSLPSNTKGGTVLLPAGSIVIPATWVPTTDTRITGEGPYSTTIEASLSGFAGSDVIDMGQEVSTSPCLSGSAYNCPDIVIEHLGVNGQGAPDSNDPAHQKIVNGIVNCCSQELGRVDDVYIQGVQTGLEVSDEGAQDSGPYTNIVMSNVRQCVTFQGGTVGVPPGTRGVHGLTCTTNGVSTNAAIVINTPNNSFEDIYVQGTSTSQDGIWVGTQGQAQGNILSNIQGNTLKSVIHLSNATGSTAGAARCPNFSATQTYPNYVCDETIFAVSGTGVTYTIKDDLTGTSLTNSNVGMYTVGEAVQGGAKSGSNVPTIGYSRLTTSPSMSPATPTWLFGATLPTSCGVGTLYSCTPTDCTLSSNTGTLWECQGGGTWKLIK